VFIIHSAIHITPVMTLTAADTLCTETIMTKGRIIMITAMAGVEPIFHLISVMINTTAAVMIITLTMGIEQATAITIILAIEAIISGLSVTPYPCKMSPAKFSMAILSISLYNANTVDRTHIQM
jgi:hypothetical protein